MSAMVFLETPPGASARRTYVSSPTLRYLESRSTERGSGGRRNPLVRIYTPLFPATVYDSGQRTL